MTEPDRGADTDAVLRAKYLDYCSAKVADILLDLSPDEMYVLAQEAAREGGVTGDLPYDLRVRLATEHVSARIGLPPFSEWARLYRSNPDYFEAQLMGFWEAEVASEPEG